jgi:AbrB family looped-hinge helix DNA binding protein
MNRPIMRVSAKGQLTIPVALRKKSDIREGDYVQMNLDGHSIRLTKVKSIEPLGLEDPIWQMVGIAESGQSDISGNHDRYLAEGEKRRWNE